jgi:exonuclease III
MPSLSFASWNVEHFEGDEARVADRVEFIRESDPDVFALYELKGEYVLFELVERMPELDVYRVVRSVSLLF